MRLVCSSKFALSSSTDDTGSDATSLTKTSAGFPFDRRQFISSTTLNPSARVSAKTPTPMKVSTTAGELARRRGAAAAASRSAWRVGELAGSPSAAADVATAGWLSFATPAAWQQHHIADSKGKRCRVGAHEKTGPARRRVKTTSYYRLRSSHLFVCV